MTQNVRYFYSNYVFEDCVMITRRVRHDHPGRDPRDRIERLTKDNDWVKVNDGETIPFDESALPYAKIEATHAEWTAAYEAWLRDDSNSAPPYPSQHRAPKEPVA